VDQGTPRWAGGLAEPWAQMSSAPRQETEIFFPTCLPAGPAPRSHVTLGLKCSWEGGAELGN
jgi:hypothetical protein